MDAHIDLRLFATLRQFSPDSPEAFLIREGTTVKTLLEALHIPQEKAKLIFINGVKSGIDSPLKQGDRLGIFPPVGGG
jgi:molybdopterin converting factor small subunit